MYKKPDNNHTTQLGLDKIASCQICINSDILKMINLHINFLLDKVVVESYKYGEWYIYETMLRVGKVISRSLSLPETT